MNQENFGNQSLQNIQKPMKSEVKRNILCSINLNNSNDSILQTPNTKHLLFTSDKSDTFKELQFSISSNNSVKRFQQQRSTSSYIPSTIKLNLSQFDQSIKNLNNQEKIVTDKLMNPIQEVRQQRMINVFSDVDGKVFNQKIELLIQENQKLIQINEQLNHQLQVLKNGSQSSILQQQLQGQINQLKLKYFLNELNYTLKIQNLSENKYLDTIEKQRQQIHQHKQQINNNESYDGGNQNQVQEIQHQNQNLTDRFKNACKEIILCKAEIERLNNSKIEQTKSWGLKITTLLSENEKLNQILCDRIGENEKQNLIVQNLREKLNKIERIYQEQISVLNMSLNQNDQRLESQMTIRNREINTLHQLLEQKEQSESIILMNLKQKVKDMEEVLIEKNEKIHQLNLNKKTSDVKWKEKCIQFELQMKSYYKNKIQDEVQKMTSRNQSLEQLNFKIQQQQLIIDNLSSKNDLFIQENENIKQILNEFTLLEQQNQQQKQLEWDKEKLKFHEIIKELKQELIQNINNRQNNQVQRQLSSNRSTSQNQFNGKPLIINNNYRQNTCLDTQSFESKHQMIEVNKKFNNEIFRRCTTILNQAI